MKKKLLMLFIGVLVLTGCNNNEISNEKPKEVSIDKAYIVDYDNANRLGHDDYARVYTIINVNPVDDINIKFDNISFSLYDTEGKEYKYQNIFTLKEKNSDLIPKNKDTKFVYSFALDKYKIKENSEFNLVYDIGIMKGEYSYTLADSINLKKDDIKMVADFDEMAKDLFNNDSEKLMIASFFWKIDAARDFYERYNSMSLANKMSAFPCQKKGIGDINEIGKYMNNFFSEETDNNLGLSNSAENYLFQGFFGKEFHYEYPKLNYDVLEKYYPGVKEQLISLNEIYNSAAKEYMSVKNNHCTTKLSYMSDSNEILKNIFNLLK